jgi:hypothetical protein
MLAALSTVIAVVAAGPASSAAPENCATFLASGEGKRIDAVRLMDRYAAGFRDAVDLACIRDDRGEPVVGNKECCLLNGAQSYLYATEAEKLAIFERQCRSQNSKQFREIVIEAIIDRMNDGQP